MNVHERIRKTLDHEETDRISILVQSIPKTRNEIEVLKRFI